MVRSIVMGESKIISLVKEKQREQIKKLTPSQRLELAVELSDLCRELLLAGKKALDDVSIKKP